MSDGGGEWREVVVKDVSGGLIIQGEQTVLDSECSESVAASTAAHGAAGAFPAGAAPLPACVSLNTKGSLPDYTARYKEESGRDELHEQANKIAEQKQPAAPALRGPPPAGHVDKMPDAASTPLAKGTYDECYAALQATLARYK